MHHLFKVFDKNPEEAVKIADSLIEYGAETDALNSDFMGCIHLAAYLGNIEAIKYAFERPKQFKVYSKVGL